MPSRSATRIACHALYTTPIYKGLFYDDPILYNTMIRRNSLAQLLDRPVFRGI